MKLTVCKEASSTHDFSIRALIRYKGQAFPASFEVFRTAFEREEDSLGLRLLHAVVEGQHQQLWTLTVEEGLTVRQWQKDTLKLYQALTSNKVNQTSVTVEGDFGRPYLLQLAKSCLVWPYRFSDYTRGGGCTRSLEDKSEAEFEGEWTLCFHGVETEGLLEEATKLADAVRQTRRLIDLPANAMTPSILAAEAVRLGQEKGFEVEVLDEVAIQEKGLNALWSVGKGSQEPPRFIVMRYRNAPQDPRVLALVGKGVCYDSGGYAIKSAAGMVTMFADMSGSAAVVGAISALASMKAEVNVTAIVAACENMISGHAFKNGDIIGSYAGKSIEIVNTDAEGRLTLADAVCYAWKDEKASAIVDIATLTGACAYSVGDKCTAVISDRDDLVDLVNAASLETGDKLWRLPHDEEYEAQNKSDRADIKNSGGPMAGTVTAGLFIRAFTNETPFLHLDIACPAYRHEADERDPKGATGVGCELLYHFARDYFGKK